MEGAVKDSPLVKPRMVVSVVGWLAIAVVGVNAFVIAMVLLSLHQSRIQAHDHAVTTATNISKILDQAISGVVARVDIGLLNISDEIERQRASGTIDQGRLNEVLFRQDKRIHDILGFRVFGRNGHLLYAVRNINNPDVSIEDRDYFKILKAANDDALVISSPQLGRGSGQWQITLARRLTSTDGAFDGAVTAVVSIDHLVALLAALDLGSHAIVAMYNAVPFPVMIIRYPREALGKSIIGTNVLSEELAEFIRSGRDSDQYDYLSPFDQMARIGAARKLGGYPLYLVVGLAETDCFADWRREARRLFGLAAAFMAVTLLLSYYVNRGWRQRTAALVRLEESNARLVREERSLGDAQRIARLGSVEIDLIQGGIHCSDQALRILGDRPEVFGPPFAGFVAGVHPEDRDRVQDALSAAVDDGRPREFECRIIRAEDNELRWLTCCWQPEQNLAGKAVRAIATIQDITERKHAEQEIARYREHLEALVADRTAALTQSNVRLAAANEAAEAALVAKSRFLAAASHDLRQQTHALRLLLSAIKADLADEGDTERADLVAEAAEASCRLSGLLDSLLDLSRLEAGAVGATLSDVPIGPLLDGLNSQFRMMREANDVRLEVVPSSLVVHTDRALLTRILANLVSNAIKFSPGGIVLVGCRRRHGEVEIQVCDTGVGIPADMIDAIFDEFRQIGNDARQNDKGLGLGLAIVKHIAPLLRAGIGVRSTFGKGSVFSISVPLARHLLPPERPSDPEVPACLWRSQGGRGKIDRVVIIDDDPQILAATEALLRPHCRLIQVFASPDEALGARFESPPDFLIADLRLPGVINGLDLIHGMRFIIGSPVPAILITGEHYLPERTRCEDVTVMRKPVDPSAILRAMNLC